jgi:hypothetical protein
MDERTVLPGQTTHDMLFNYAVLKRGFVAGVCATLHLSLLTSHFSLLTAAAKPQPSLLRVSTTETARYPSRGRW